MTFQLAHSAASFDHHRFPVTATLFGPLTPDGELNQHTQRVLKSHKDGEDYFTEITLIQNRHQGGMVVQYQVEAGSPQAAERLGLIYLSQLCDLLSALTRCPVQYYPESSDAHQQQLRQQRQQRQMLHVGRELRQEEWDWVTGNLVALRREHPRFLAAASWYRKGLIGEDCLDQFCCYLRTIERLSEHYKDTRNWTEKDGGTKRAIAQLTEDLFPQAAPSLLASRDQVKRAWDLRNDISHGNEPITVELVEQANEMLQEAENAAFALLHEVRLQKLTFPLLDAI